MAEYPFVGTYTGKEHLLTNRDHEDSHLAIGRCITQLHTQYIGALKIGPNALGDSTITTAWLYDQSDAELIEAMRLTDITTGVVTQEMIAIDTVTPEQGKTAQRVYRWVSPDLGGSGRVTRFVELDTVERDQKWGEEIQKIIRGEERKMEMIPPAVEFHPEGAPDMSEFKRQLEPVVPPPEAAALAKYILDKVSRHDYRPVTQEEAWRLQGFDV